MEESIYLLIPISVFLVFAIGVAFWWSVRSGQFDDLEGPAYRILMDDKLPAAHEGKEAVSAAEASSDGVRVEGGKPPSV